MAAKNWARFPFLWPPMRNRGGFTPAEQWDPKSGAGRSGREWRELGSGPRCGRDSGGHGPDWGVISTSGRADELKKRWGCVSVSPRTPCPVCLPAARALTRIPFSTGLGREKNYCLVPIALFSMGGGQWAPQTENVPGANLRLCPSAPGLMQPREWLCTARGGQSSALGVRPHHPGQGSQPD